MSALMVLVLLCLSISAGLIVTYLQLRKELDIVRNRLMTGAVGYPHYTCLCPTLKLCRKHWKNIPSHNCHLSPKYSVIDQKVTAEGHQANKCCNGIFAIQPTAYDGLY